MNLSKLLMLAGAGLSIVASSHSASNAEDWREKVPEVRISVRSNENAEGMSKWNAFVDYLQTELKQKVVLHQSADYAGTVEALRAKRLEVAVLGGAAYVQAWIATNGNIQPLAQPARNGTETGYYSAVLVKADSSFKSIDDLKGHSIAFPDPNSTSGFEVPTYFLRKEGKDYKSFFSRNGFAGNHESAVMAVANGTYDAAATWQTTPGYNNADQMATKGLIPAGAMRSVWVSPKIEENAHAVRGDLPDSFKADLKNALLTLPKKHPEILKAIGNYDNMVPADHEKFAALLEMIQENLKARRGK